MEDGLALVFAKVGEVGVLSGLGEDGVDFGEDDVFDEGGEVGEGLGMNEVGAAVFEEVSAEVEVAEGAAVAGSAGVF